MMDWVDGPNSEAVLAAFAARFQKLAGSGPDPFPVALTGGESAAAFYEALAKKGVPGSAHFYWSDERLVPLDSADSNYRLALDHLLRPAAVPAARCHPSPVSLLPAEAAKAYADEIRRDVPAGPDGIPRFPLLILGLGEDGHTGSLFPHRDPYRDDRALVRWVEPTPDHPHARITFTPGLINAAAEVWFVVTGETKAWAVDQLRRRDADVETVPSLVVDPARTHVTVFRA